jgi:flagellar hook-associated protein 3 FlgL
MTRIASFAHSQLLMNHMLEAQRRTYENHVKVSSGKESTDFQGYGRELNALLAARSTGARTEAYLMSNTELASLLELQNNALGELASVADDLRENLIKAVNLNSPLALETKVEELLDRTINALNTRYNGRYVFGGTRNDTEPINVDNATDLLALANVSDAFDNNTVKREQQIDDNRRVTYGILASDIATPLLNSIQRILQFNAGTLPSGAGAYAPAGAFQDPLPKNQRDFLVAEFNTALIAADNARAIEADNGVNMAMLDQLRGRQEEDLTFLKGFIYEIENVDMAEAVSNLKQSESALEASMQVLARMTRLTLLDFV